MATCSGCGLCAGEGRAGKRLCGVDELVMDGDMVRRIGHQFSVRNIDKPPPSRTSIVAAHFPSATCDTRLQGIQGKSNPLDPSARL